MSNLTLTFQQMFFVVNRPTGAAVLFPSALHTATLSSAILPAPITLSGVDAFVRRNGTQLKGAATLRTGARLMALLDCVFHTEVRPRKELLAGPVPAELHARFFLSGGFFTALPAMNPTATDIVWSFTKPDGSVVLTQNLTDQAMFTLPLDADANYQLVIRTGTSEQVIDVPAAGAAFVIFNEDQPEGVNKSADTRHVLTQFSLIYDLTSAKAPESTYPYPIGYTSSKGGPHVMMSGQPICVAGQGDGDDDPPPP